MNSLENISAFWSAIVAAGREFVEKQKATDKENAAKFREWFQSTAEKIGDSFEQLGDDVSKKFDLKEFLDENGEITSPKTYPNTEEGRKQAKADGLLLGNFYELEESEDGETITFKFNKYGEALAGEDGKISKEELEAINKNGICSQLDINKFKKALDDQMAEEKQPTDLAAFLDEDGFLPTELDYPVTDAGLEKREHDKFLIDSLYEPDEVDESEVKDGQSIPLHLNKYGKLLAGEDGKISKEELMALDTDGDGKVSKKEFDAWKKEQDTRMKEEENPTSLTTFLDKDGQIKSPLEYEDTEEGKAQMEHDKLLLETLYKKVETEDGKIKYEFNDFALKIAGEDGIISKDELLALDKNKDDKVSAKEVESARKKNERKEDREAMEDAWHSTNAYQNWKARHDKRVEFWQDKYEKLKNIFKKDSNEE